MRHQPDELSPVHDTRKDLQNPHQNNGREQVFNAVFGYQRNHDNSQRTRRTRDHARTATDDRCDQAHHEGCIEPYQRVDASNKGEGHGLGHKGQGNGQARQKLGFDPRRRQLVIRRQAQIRAFDTIGKACQQGSGHGVTSYGELFAMGLSNGFGPVGQCLR